MMNGMRATAIIAIAIAATLAGSSTVVAATDEPSTLLAKHAAFVGWSGADGTVRSWRLSGAGFRSVRRGEAFRTTISTNDSISYDNGFTGRVFWTANENGNVATVYDEAAKRAASQSALFFEETATLRGIAHGTTTQAGATYPVVRVIPPGGVPIDLAIDPTTGAYESATIDPGNDETTFDIDAYADLEAGKKFIAAYHVGRGKSRVATKIESNVAISDDELHPPKSRQTWSFADGDSVPIDPVLHTAIVGGGGRAILIRASFDGNEGTFLFDSGAASIVVSDRFAKNLELKDLGETGFSGVAGNRIAARTALVKTIAFGKSTLSNSIVTVAPSQSTGTLDGIIGYDVLAGAIVDVDLVSKTATFLDPARFTPTPPKDAYAFDVDVSTGQPRVRATLSGSPFSPIVDTGDDFLVVASETFRRDHASFVDQRAILGGVDGRSEILPCSRIGNMSVGPVRYEHVLTCFGSDREWGSKGGLVGFDFLRHFNWTFDYPDGKLVLTPNGR